MENNFILSASRGFLDGCSANTIFGRQPAPAYPALDTRWKFYYLSNIFVGISFGILGLMVVLGLQRRVPEIVAWGLPLIWLFLNCGLNLRSLSKVFDGICFKGSREQQLAEVKNPISGTVGMMIAVVFFLGKSAAFSQSQLTDTLSLALAAFYAPLLARYTAVLLTLGDRTSDGTAEKIGNSDTLFVVLGSTALVFLLCAASPALGFTMLVAVLLAALILRASVFARFRSIPPETAGATIEICEVVALWIPVLLSQYGVTLIPSLG